MDQKSDGNVGASGVRRCDAETVVEELGEGDLGGDLGVWLEADRAERAGALGALAGDRLGVEWWLALAEVAL